MLDESMFEDIHEIAENSAYLKAVEEKDVSLEMLEQLPPYDELRGLEEKLRFDNKLTFDSIFNEPTGYYMIKCFLIADYAVDKAIFIKDVEAYKSMRFESARRKVALLLYQRFVATDETPAHDFKQGSSVFQIIQSHKGGMDDKSGMVGGAGGGGGVASSAPMSGGGMGAKGFDKSDNGKGDKTEKTVVSSNLPSQSNLTQMSATAGHGMGHGGGNGDEFGGGAAGGAAGRARNESTFQMGTNNNPIGVYGRGIRVVKDRVMRGEAPKDLFDEVARDVMTDLKLDVFPRFLKSDFYKKYIRTKWTETQRVLVKDFTTFRVLGRGGFGAVHACRKKNSGQIYAMKCINKKLVKVKSALDNVLEERNVLTMMKSNFVTNLKYALQDEDTLFLIMDLMCLTEDTPVIKADGSVVPVGKVVAGDSLCSRGGQTVKVLSNDPAPVSLLYEVGDAGGNDYRVSAEHVLVLRWDRDPWTANAEPSAPGGYRAVKAMWFDVNMNFHERVVALYFLAGEADPAALHGPIPSDPDVAILGQVTEAEAEAHGRAYLAGLDKSLVWQAGAEVRMTAQAFYELWQEEGGKGAVQHLRSVLAPLPGNADADPLAAETSEKQLAGDELSFQMREPKKIQLSGDETVNVMKIRVDGDHTFLQASGVVTHNCGGDLKFHLINAGRFTEKRARFYAAQVLLGLEHVHALSIIYRDMKLENVLLDHAGQCRLSDLGLAVVTKVKIKGYAGTPGYTAPEMIKNKLYGPAADIFSYGVMLYRMLCGSKPFKGKVDRDLDKAVIERKPQFPKEIFSKEAILLLTGLLQKRPENRMGCGERGIEEIKESPFFDSIDWGLLEAGYIDPPFVPNKFDVNAASLKDIGDFDRAKYKHVKLDDRFKQRIKNFEYVSAKALQDEMVLVLEKADENVNFEKFAHQPEKQEQTQVVANGPCCSIA